MNTHAVVVVPIVLALVVVVVMRFPLHISSLHHGDLVPRWWYHVPVYETSNPDPGTQPGPVNG